MVLGVVAVFLPGSPPKADEVSRIATYFAIGGAFGFIVPLATLVWILAASIVMLRPGPMTRSGAAT